MALALSGASPRLVAIAALCALAGLSQHAQATNGYFAHGYGIQSEGIAGVGIALPQDSLAAATNPAGTAFVGSRLDIGLNYFEPSRSARIEGNNLGPFGSLDGEYSGNGKRRFFIPEFGYTRVLSPTLSAGLAVYGNGGMNTRYEQNPFSALGASGRAGVNLEQLFVSPSIAWRATSDQVLGVALNLAWQRFSADGLGPFTAASASPNDVTNRGTDTSSGVGVRLACNSAPPGHRRSRGASTSTRASLPTMAASTSRPTMASACPGRPRATGPSAWTIRSSSTAAWIRWPTPCHACWKARPWARRKARDSAGRMCAW